MKSGLKFLIVLETVSLLLFSFLCTANSAQAATRSSNVAADLQHYVDDHTLAGAVVLWADRNHVLGLEAVGYADIAKGTWMKTGALFWIASMSKPLTATALMMLVDEGKVKLSDPVEKYLPEFQGQWLEVEQDDQHQLLKPPSRPITVEDVLSHTSGLPFMSRVEHKIDSYPLSAAALTYALTPLKFESGTKYDYSNAGINRRRLRIFRPMRLLIRIPDL